MSIAGNIAEIEERIVKACLRSGRKREEITLCYAGIIAEGIIRNFGYAQVIGCTYFSRLTFILG